MKRSITLLVCFCFMCSLGAQEPGISVKPVRLFYSLLNGESQVQTVYVFNNTQKKQQFRLYMMDWVRDSMGGHRYLKLDSFQHSCSKWTSFNKDFIEIGPGESTEVLVKVQVPDTVDAIKEMKWTMLFIETIEEKVAPAPVKGFRTAVNNITRIGVHVVQTPPTVKGKELKMLSFKRAPGKNHYRIICQNTGETQFDCNSYVELSSVATGEKTTIRAKLFPLFPEQVRYVDFYLPDNLAKGKYTMLGVLDAGDDLPLIASETTIDFE